jgi:flagellar motor switch protein FliG
MESAGNSGGAGAMTQLQKLAALLILLGPESAAQMLKHLDPREVEAISHEMARMPAINQELQQEILEEFAEVAVHASTSVLGGVNYTRNALEKSVGMFRASDILSRVAPASAPNASMQPIIDMDARQLFSLLKNEQPQTIALVVSYLPPDKGSQLVALLHGEMRDDVVERLATLAPTPIEVVERVADMLGRKVGVKPSRGLSQTGGLKNAADLLNALGKNLNQTVLSELEKRNPEIVMAIRHKMFTFEDLALLDKASLQKVMREVDMRDLAVSLKNASEKVNKVLLSSISKRAAETVREEMSFLPPQKKRDIEAAQLHIIESVRQLEAEGEVDLSAVTNPSRDELVA